MPKLPAPTQPSIKIEATTEATHYLKGLFQEFVAQVHRYHTLTGELASLEARVELAEKTMCLTRDHLALSVQNTDSAMPHDWNKVVKSVRFVGCRLVDACLDVLKDRRKLKPEELRDELNHGMFRFRTHSPLREIHAALMRQPSVQRIDDAWVWVGEQTTMPLHVVKRGSDDKLEESEDVQQRTEGA
jgi:hypothetical protein